MRDAMPALFDRLESETQPGVRAVLGHWLFGYVHPYPDGNGRMARFVMNAMLASGGYPWTVIRVEDRDTYLAALDRASIDMDIAPFPASSRSGCAGLSNIRVLTLKVAPRATLSRRSGGRGFLGPPRRRTSPVSGIDGDRHKRSPFGACFYEAT